MPGGIRWRCLRAVFNLRSTDIPIRINRIGLTRYAGVATLATVSISPGESAIRQLNRETMRWRHVALFVSQRSCQ